MSEYLSALNNVTYKNTEKFNFDGMTVYAKCIDVYDGDTAKFAFNILSDPANITWQSIRFAGYNSAEIRGSTQEEKDKAVAARNALISKIGNRIVTLKLGKFDKYGRTLGTVFVDDENINQWMISKGHGIEYTGRGQKKW